MVLFKNGQSLETIAVYGGTIQFQNANRKTLEFVCDSGVITLDDAKALWQNVEATKEITIVDNSDSEESDVVQSVHLDFTIPVEMKLSIENGTEVVKFKLAQKSVLEIAQEQQAEDISNNEAALIELAELIAGGIQ